MHFLWAVVRHTPCCQADDAYYLLCQLTEALLLVPVPGTIQSALACQRMQPERWWGNSVVIAKSHEQHLRCTAVQTKQRLYTHALYTCCIPVT